MIPIVDMTEGERLSEELQKHPLYERRRFIQSQFLDELTKLTRKYGLELKADTYSSYGETYPEHVLEVPMEGTEGRYVLGDRGVVFEPVKKEDILPFTEEEKVVFLKAKADRDAEDKVINDLHRRISNANSAAFNKGINEMVQREIADMNKRKPVHHCPCGDKFKSAGALKEHKESTGHGM